MSEDARLSRGGLGDAPARAGVAQAELADVVKTPRECVGCGYELKGQPVAGVCPECGVAVARTLAVELFRDEPNSLLKRVRSGLLLYAIGPVVALGVWLIVVITAQIGVLRMNSSVDEALTLASMLISFAGVAMTLLGAFALSIAPVVGSRLRWVVRGGSGCLVLGVGGLVAIEYLPGRRSDTAGDVAAWVMVAGIALVVLGVSRCVRRVMPKCNSQSGERIARRGVVAANVFACGLLVFAVASFLLFRLTADWYLNSSTSGLNWFYVLQLLNGFFMLNVVVWVVLNAVVHVRLARRVDRERAIAAALSPARVSGGGE